MIRYGDAKHTSGYPFVTATVFYCVSNPDKLAVDSVGASSNKYARWWAGKAPC